MTSGEPTNSLTFWLAATCAAVWASLTSVDAAHDASFAAVSSGSQPLTYREEGLGLLLRRGTGEHRAALGCRFQAQGTGRQGRGPQQEAAAVELTLLKSLGHRIRRGGNPGAREGAAPSHGERLKQPFPTTRRVSRGTRRRFTQRRKGITQRRKEYKCRNLIIFLLHFSSLRLCGPLCVFA